MPGYGSTTRAVRTLVADGRSVAEIVRHLDEQGHKPASVYAALSRARAPEDRMAARKKRPRVVSVNLSKEAHDRLLEHVRAKRTTVSMFVRALLADALTEGAHQ